MARTILNFSIDKTDGIDPPQALEFRPEEQGYSVWIDNRRRYEGQTFTTAEVRDRLYHISRGYDITTQEKTSEKFLIRNKEGD